MATWQEVIAEEKTRGAPAAAGSWRDVVAAEKAAAPKIGAAEAALAGAAQGLSFGFADEAIGAVKGAARTLTDGGSLRENYARARDERREYEKQAAADSPAAYVAGQVAGIVPTLLVPGAGVARATTVAGRLAQAAAGGGALGGLAGAGYSTEDSAAGVLADAAGGAALGAAGAGIVPGLGAAARTGGRVAGGAINTVTDPTLLNAAAASHLMTGDLATAGLLKGAGKVSEIARRRFGAPAESPTGKAVGDFIARRFLNR